MDSTVRSGCAALFRDHPRRVSGVDHRAARFVCRITSSARATFVRAALFVAALSLASGLGLCPPQLPTGRVAGVVVGDAVGSAYCGGSAGGAVSELGSLLCAGSASSTLDGGRERGSLALLGSQRAVSHPELGVVSAVPTDCVGDGDGGPVSPGRGHALAPCTVRTGHVLVFLVVGRRCATAGPVE